MLIPKHTKALFERNISQHGNIAKEWRTKVFRCTQIGCHSVHTKPKQPTNSESQGRQQAK